MYISLTNHSAYSLQEGLSLPAELVQAAAADGMPALGLTDHRLLSGTVEFVSACKKAGVQPVLGLEVDLENGPVALLAMDLAGWANLCALSSALALRMAAEAPCPADLLAAHSEFPDLPERSARKPARAAERDLPQTTLSHAARSGLSPATGRPQPPALHSHGGDPPGVLPDPRPGCPAADTLRDPIELPAEPDPR